MSDVLDKKLNLPRGLSPVVFVFDDASPEQFRYIDKNGKLEIDPTSGIGIWLDFTKTHPGLEEQGGVLPALTAPRPATTSSATAEFRDRNRTGDSRR